MLEALVGIVVGLLIITGVLIIIGPANLRGLARRARTINRPTTVPAVFQAARTREATVAGLSPKTQRVLVGAAKLATWLRSHGHDDIARELRAASARMTANEPAGLYSMQSVIRKVRALGAGEPAAQERLNALANELRTAVQDRFEQLELLPFKKP